MTTILLCLASALLAFITGVYLTIWLCRWALRAHLPPHVLKHLRTYRR